MLGRNFDIGEILPILKSPKGFIIVGGRDRRE
jgi:hypothetical protein